jgi:hypothetical protein
MQPLTPARPPAQPTAPRACAGKPADLLELVKVALGVAQDELDGLVVRRGAGADPLLQRAPALASAAMTNSRRAHALGAQLTAGEPVRWRMVERICTTELSAVGERRSARNATQGPNVAMRGGP